MPRSFRQAILLSVSIFAAAAVSCNRANPHPGGEGGESGEPSPERLLDEGEALVGEIGEFRREFGHWPVSLAQLKPNPSRGPWRYKLDPDFPSQPGWQVDRVDGSPRSALRFVFALDSRCGEWQLRWDEFTKQSQSTVTFPETKVGARRDVGAIIAKLQSDRKADPRHDLLYTKVLLHFRMEAGEFASAIMECGAARDEYPDDLWLTSCLTAALVHDGFVTRSGMPLPVEMRAAVTGRISDFVYAACICHELGLTARAAKLLDEAFSGDRFRTNVSEPQTDEGDCWRASVMAVRLKDYELLSRVAEAWSAKYRADGYGDASFRAFRAFANLKNGRLTEARTEMRELCQQILKQPIWARNTNALADAIEKGDSAFEFNPGSFPALHTCILHVK